MARPVLKKSAKNATQAKKTKIKSPIKKAISPKVKSKAMPKAKTKTQKSLKSVVKKKGKVIVKKTAPKKLAAVNKVKRKQTEVDKNKKQVNQKAVKKNDVQKSVKNIHAGHQSKVVNINTVLKNREAKKMKSTLTKVVEHTHFHPEEYMTPEHQTHFREILLNWKKQLLGEMERTVHQMQDEVTVFADPNDRATQEEEFSIELRTRDRERKLIKKIEEAIDRLGRNDYGYCEDCGVEIGLKRLEARPTATLCIDCKTIEEIREKSSSE